jgi:hypothetical protein
MKISPETFPARSRQRQSGVAVIVMLALLSIMLIYIAANSRSLSHLDRELKLIEQRQIQRLERLSATLRTPPAADTNAVLAEAKPAMPAL